MIPIKAKIESGFGIFDFDGCLYYIALSHDDAKKFVLSTRRRDLLIKRTLFIDSPLLRRT